MFLILLDLLLNRVGFVCLTIAEILKMQIDMDETPINMGETPFNMDEMLTNMAETVDLSLPRKYRFAQTNQELIKYYLLNKTLDKALPCNKNFSDIDIFDDLPDIITCKHLNL